MDLRFDDRVAIVTGAGKGLGRAYAIGLAARGARVLVNNRRHAGEPSGSADATVEAIRNAGGEALANYCAIEEPEASERIVEQALTAWGRIDIVIHNAAVARGGYFTRMSADDFDYTMRVNFSAPVALTRAVLPQLRAGGYGRMLFSTSAAGLYGNRGQSAYSASKAATLGFMQSIRLEERGYDFRVNAIAPFADTQMTAGYMPGQSDGRFAPELAAAMAIWLVHEDCPASGEVIIAGGGVFRNARTMEGAGLRSADGGELTPEAIARRFDEIRSLANAAPQDSADDCFRRVVEEAGSTRDGSRAGASTYSKR